ncbi:hypothetical protein TNCV_2197391 [Trichonephila clavipes]|nr:hypothetical protein TNCV_2197391 [Trichonephila clavipes]
MDEQLKVLLEGINALKCGQEETRARNVERSGRNEEKPRRDKNELKDRMEKGLENVQKCQEEQKYSLEEKSLLWKRKIALKVEEKDCSS